VRRHQPAEQWRRLPARKPILPLLLPYAATAPYYCPSYMKLDCYSSLFFFFFFFFALFF
jgi:hypothetical protein